MEFVISEYVSVRFLEMSQTLESKCNQWLWGFGDQRPGVSGESLTFKMWKIRKDSNKMLKEQCQRLNELLSLTSLPRNLSLSQGLKHIYLHFLIRALSFRSYIWCKAGINKIFNNGYLVDPVLYLEKSSLPI